MNWIIVLLIVIGVISRAGKKKRQQQASFDKTVRLKSGDVERIAEVIQKTIRDFEGERKGELPPRRPEQPAAKPPYTREEWQKRFAAPKPQPAGMPMADKAAPTAASIKALENGVTGSMQLPPEGMEGESPLEHAAHRQRVIADEERIHREHEQLRELRSINLQKLRSAVVMSEVLGKPVSLRPRARR